MRIEAHDLCQIKHLNDVNTPLAVLNVCHEWLVPTKLLGDLCLMKVSLIPVLGKEFC